MGIEIVGLAAWGILAAPFVVLLLAMLLFVRRNAGMRERIEAVPAAQPAVAAGPAVVQPQPGPAQRATVAPPAARAEPAARQPTAPQPASPPPTSAPARQAWPDMRTPAPPAHAPVVAPVVRPTPPQAPATAAPAPAVQPPPARPTLTAPPPPPPDAAPPPEEAEAEPAPPPPPPRPDFAGMVAAAEAGNDIEHLPTLYVALARQQREDGAPARQVGELLRKAIRMAATHGQKLAHAVARIELGDLEGASGDMTSACEHWQIARSLYHELRQTKDVAATDARMRRHGCPTDWVLNDF